MRNNLKVKNERKIISSINSSESYHKGVQPLADPPLTTSFTFTGNIGLAIDAIAFPSYASPGTFTLSGIPAGSVILQALMYVQRWTEPLTNASAVFDGNALGPITPFATESYSGWLLQSYRFDVTSFVTGDGSYPFSFSTNGGFNYYAALVVVFRHPSEPSQIIAINDGAVAVDNGSFTTAFNNMQAGSGMLTIVTQSDDPSAGTDESISFNENIILGGPGQNIFNANLGPVASMFQLPVNVVNGTNTASLTSFDDLFGWHIAILQGTLAARGVTFQ